MAVESGEECLRAGLFAVKRKSQGPTECSAGVGGLPGAQGGEQKTPAGSAFAEGGV